MEQNPGSPPLLGRCLPTPACLGLLPACHSPRPAKTDPALLPDFTVTL
jgi:hypothetical protein